MLVMVHEQLVPPTSMEGYTDAQMAEWKTEYDVVATLRDLGHDVLPLGLSDEIGVLRKAVQKFRPHVVFNLLEEFHSVAAYDQYVIGYLELLRQPYTGCNPRGMFLTRDKALSKKVLAYHRIPTPRFAVFPTGRSFRLQRELSYPLFVKSATEDASIAISQASIVHDAEQLRERVDFVHRQTESDALVEEYVEGRELYVGVIGNVRLTTYPIWEMFFEKMPEGVARIASNKVKWDHKYQQRHGVNTGPAQDLSAATVQQVERLVRRIYRALQMSGYARMDLRLRADGRVFVLEANANPNLSYGEDFAESAHSAGVSYEALLQRIISLGINYQAAWRE